MGLDQWLMAKTKIKITDQHTGVCSGMFGIIPKTVAEKQEIGYWRKAYDQNQLICDNVGASFDKETGDMPITLDEVGVIIEKAKHVLLTHKFDPDDGSDITPSEDIEWGEFESEEWTFDSKRKWEDTIRSFEKAKEILQKDPDAKIYYHIWC